MARRWPTWTRGPLPVPGGGRAVTWPEDARQCGLQPNHRFEMPSDESLSSPHAILKGGG